MRLHFQDINSLSKRLHFKNLWFTLPGQGPFLPFLSLEAVNNFFLFIAFFLRGHSSQGCPLGLHLQNLLVFGIILSWFCCNKYLFLNSKPMVRLSILLQANPNIILHLLVNEVPFTASIGHLFVKFYSYRLGFSLLQFNNL